MFAERIESYCMVADEILIIKFFPYDDVHHAERQRRIGSRADQVDFVGLRGSLALADVDGNNSRATFPRLHDMARGVRLTRKASAPQNYKLRIGAHILFCAGGQCSGQPDAECAEPPTDHRRTPVMTAQ